MKIKKLLLKATEYNWGLNGPGDWVEVTWLVFVDGSYEVCSVFNPTISDYEGITDPIDIPSPRKKTFVGILHNETFIKLQKALMCEPWQDPSLLDIANDGTAWKIELYRDDGSIEKTNGGVNYIYGNYVLETIVDLLPSRKSLFKL